MSTKKAPKAPKLKKYPKKPKTSAPLSSWERFHEKCKLVEKENAEKKTAHEKAVNAFEAGKKKKATLIKNAQGLSGVASKKTGKRK